MAPMPILPLLALAAASPETAEAERGLWLGTIALCRETVADAVLAADELDGRPALALTLRPELRTALERETKGRVGEPLPLRLDGRVLAEPVVREPLTAGGVHLSGLDDVEAVRRAALAPCPREPGASAPPGGRNAPLARDERTRPDSEGGGAEEEAFALRVGLR